MGVCRVSKNLRYIAAAFLLLICPRGTVCGEAPGAARLRSFAPLAIVQPANDLVGGVCRLAVATRIKSIASVEYRLGSRRLGIAQRPPFAIGWNTAYAADGSCAVQAIARDSFGQVVAAADRAFTIRNRGNSMKIAGPALPSTLSGTLTLSFSATDTRYYPALWLGYIDGEILASAWTDNLGRHSAAVTMRLDTTRFTNGRHELYVAMHSDFWPPAHRENKSYYNWRGAYERVVDIENGRTLMDIAANYLHVYLRPGRRLALTCRRLFTDGSSGACAAPLYTSSDGAVAAVSAAGMLTARRPGFAVITLADGGKSTAVRVWVRNADGIPHFAGDGRMLGAYRRGRSLFVVAPFVLQPADLRADPVLTAEVRRAGVNTLSRGFYLNPRDLRADYRAWMRSLYNSAAPDWLFARDHGFHIFGTGDDVARNIGGEAWWTLNWPYGKYAVQYAMTLMASTGVAIGADMVDEASMMWGATPKPPGKVGAPASFTAISCCGMKCRVRWPHNPVTPKRFPSGVRFALDHSLHRSLNTPPGQMFTATDIGPDSFAFRPAGPLSGTFTARNDPNLEFLWWAGNIGGCPAHPCIPPVPNSALTDITGWIHTAARSVPISWPVLGIAPAVVQGNWMGRGGISDYASHYWDSFNLRHTYPWSGGVQEFNYWMRELFYQRQPLMLLDRPQLFLAGISSFMYVKQTPGAAYYTPPADRLQTPGLAGPATTSTIMTAAALGGAGVRLYQFEPPRNLAARVKAPLGTTLQTGASPLATDPAVRENWRAMAFAASPLTKTLAPYVLGRALSSPAYGRNIVTAARQGLGGRMLMIVNGNDWPRTVAVDFTPYRTGSPAVRYRIAYDGIATDVVSNRGGERATLDAGETLVYLFPAAGEILKSVAVAAPSLDKPGALRNGHAGRPELGGASGPRQISAERLPCAAPALAPAHRAILHYSYIYQESLPASFTGIECTRGCQLFMDRSLGGLYYRMDYVDACGAVSGRSPTMVLPPSP